jgi:hypothetical protein
MNFKFSMKATLTPGKMTSDASICNSFSPFQMKSKHIEINAILSRKENPSGMVRPSNLKASNL